jgi:hypothetical protein
MPEPTTQMTGRTRRLAVGRLLGDGLWHSTSEVCHPGIGGSEGCRRLRELRLSLRKDGVFDIEKRRCLEGSQYEYRMMRTKENQWKLFK